MPYARSCKSNAHFEDQRTSKRARNLSVLFYIFLGHAKISNGYPCSQPPKEPLTIKSQVK